MKSYRFHIAGLLLLAIVVVLIYQNRKGTSLNMRDIDFALEDRDRIAEVTIRGGGEEVVLTRDNGLWILNSQFEARDKAVDMLLQTLARLRVSSPAPLAETDAIMKNLSNDALQIDIDMGRRTRRYFVFSEGGESPTYMLRDGSSRPYRVEVLGYDGNVASLFVPDGAFWRSNILFNVRLIDIAEVSVDHREDQEGSFTLKQSPQNEYALYSYPEGEIMEGLSDSLAIRYLANFFYVPYERMAGRDERTVADSLLRSGYDHMIKVTLHEGSVTKAYFHRIVTGGGGEEEVNYDLFRLYALINDKSDLVIVPYHSVDLLLRNSSYFFR